MSDIRIVFQPGPWDEWAAAIAKRQDRDAALAALAGQVTDWDAWLTEARTERLSGAIWTAMRDAGVESALPSATANELESEWRQSVAASALLHYEVAGIGAALAAEEVPWIMLKGPSVSDSLYQDPGARTSVDIDILIKPDDVHKVISILESSGWLLREDMHPRYIRITHIVMIKTAPQVSLLEVHWCLLGTVPLKSEEVLWDTLEAMDIGGRLVPILNASDKALHLCVHIVLHHGLIPVSQLLDVVLACLRLDRQGWDSFVSHARKLGVVEEALLALTAARKRQGLLVPESVLESLESSRPGWLRRKAVQMAICDANGHAAMTISRLIIMQGWKRKWRYGRFVLFPPAEWMKELPDGNSDAIYFRRAFSGIVRAVKQFVGGARGKP